MNDPARLPVLLAGGHALERDGIHSALDLAERAASAALDHVPRARDVIDVISVVDILSRPGPSPASVLAERLGIGAARREVSTIGGNSPQWLVTRAATAIARGEIRAALILGGEAMRSQRERRAARAKGTGNRDGTAAANPGTGGGELDPGGGELDPDPVVGDDRPGIGDAEMAIGLLAPVHIYPMFEAVIAHRLGRTFGEHRRELGRLLAPFTEVAAKHPAAWFPVARTAEDIAEVRPGNRIVAEPYTKLMSAFIGGDQGAAVIVTSLEQARRAGAGDGVVFILSGADANDVWFPSARRDPGSSPGIRAAATAALDAAGMTVDDLDLFDLYSCFPSAVEMAAGALGVRLDDPRGLTVTGGLAYFGGPGNNYTTHAIATMAAMLLEAPVGAAGLVTGLGWYATKHSVGLYATSPPGKGFRTGDTAGAQAEIDSSAAGVVAGAGEATTATVVACTVVYGPDGAVTAAPVIARLDDGRQLVAAAAPAGSSGGSGAGSAPGGGGAPDQDLAGRNLVGCRVCVEGRPPRYRPLDRSG